MNYNPYDLVQLLINGKPMQGRPFEFDSDIVNQKTMCNAFGVLVKPSKVMSICPDCSQGLEITLQLGEPPFEPVVWSCPYCKPAPPPMSDPFVNPVKTGRVPSQELDPILLDPTKPLDISAGSVADRFSAPSEPSSVQVVAKPAQRPSQSSSLKKNKKKAKEQPTTPTGSISGQKLSPLAQQIVPPPLSVDPFILTKTEPNKSILEKAEGVGEEQDFDDSDMIEEV